MRTHDGLELHVRVDGPEDAALTVVLVHCWTGDHDTWRYQVRDLRSTYGHGVRIVSYDQRGHGLSDPTSRQDATIQNLARDLSDLVDLHAPVGDLVLAGHSLGGMAIMELTLQRPQLFAERVKGLCLVATSGGSLRHVTLGLPDFGERIKDAIPFILAFRSRTLSKKQRLRAPIIESLVVRRFLFGDTMRLRDHMLTVEGLVNTPSDSMTGFFEDLMLHDRAHGLTEVLADLPVVVLVGDKDVLTPPEHARRLAVAIPGARLIHSPGAGHMLPLERDTHVSEVLADLVAGALAQQVPETPETIQVRQDAGRD